MRLSPVARCYVTVRGFAAKMYRYLKPEEYNTRARGAEPRPFHTAKGREWSWLVEGGGRGAARGREDGLEEYRHPLLLANISHVLFPRYGSVYLT